MRKGKGQSAKQPKIPVSPMRANETPSSPINSPIKPSPVKTIGIVSKHMDRAYEETLNDSEPIRGYGYVSFNRAPVASEPGNEILPFHLSPGNIALDDLEINLTRLTDSSSSYVTELPNLLKMAWCGGDDMVLRILKGQETLFEIPFKDMRGFKWNKDVLKLLIHVDDPTDGGRDHGTGAARALKASYLLLDFSPHKYSSKGTLNAFMSLKARCYKISESGGGKRY